MAEPRLIDAHDLWTEIMMLPHNGDMISSEAVEKAIVDAPTVDAVPAVHGRWISVDGTQECDEWDCSVCARRLTFGEEMNAEDVYDLNPFCSQCGTRMDRGGSRMDNDGKLISFPTYNVSLGAACAIVEAKLDDDTIAITTKVLAIEKVARMETHNSITKDELVRALRWLFDHYDFS